MGDTIYMKTYGELIGFISTPTDFDFSVKTTELSGEYVRSGPNFDITTIKATGRWGGGGYELTFICVNGRIVSVSDGKTTYNNVIGMDFHEGDLSGEYVLPDGTVDKFTFPQFR